MRLLACLAATLVVAAAFAAPARAAQETAFGELIKALTPSTVGDEPAVRVAQTRTNIQTGRQYTPPPRSPAWGDGGLFSWFEQAAISTKFRRQMVPSPGNYRPGTIVINTRERFLYHVQADGSAMRYGIGVGRQGFTWRGSAHIGDKRVWPGWTPPASMRAREPWLPAHMPGGPDNPLGARALYLYQGDADTLYRIHGTNQPETIGKAVSSGCIRLLNDDIIHLYERVRRGARVVVI